MKRTSVRLPAYRLATLGACNPAHPLISDIIADTSVQALTDCVCGANKEGFHYMHVYPQRDMAVTRYADVHFIADGDGCPKMRRNAFAAQGY